MESKTTDRAAAPAAEDIIAFAKGGSTSLKNAQAMHAWCNSGKGAH
jgi:hypothetical protein